MAVADLVAGVAGGPVVILVGSVALTLQPGGWLTVWAAGDVVVLPL